jgi:hypothetical protein
MRPKSSYHNQMNRMSMANEIMEDFYQVKQFDTQKVENVVTIGKITEKDKFIAAKQILLGLAFLYVLTLLAYLLRPVEGLKLLDICTTTFPPLATLILVFYFRQTHV